MMMADRSVELTPTAVRDIEAAVEWYDARAPRLGDEFLERVGALLEQISRQPLIYVEAEQGVRRGLLKRFPYAVYYFHEGNLLTVIAVLHTSRRPDYWKDRDE